MAKSVASTLYNFVLGRARKFFRNYNVLERTEKLMDTEKLKAAPRHPGTEKKINYIIKERPEVDERLSKPPTDLLKRLKSVRVESTDTVQEQSETTKERPQDRMAHSIPDFGYEDPKVVPDGRCSLRQALHFITNNQNDPQKWTNEFIANKYKMQVSDVEHVTENFKPFEIILTGMKKNTPLESTLETLGVNKPKKLPFYERHKKTVESIQPDSAEKNK